MTEDQPKLFLSYSWSNPEHEARVLQLAEELTSQGVHVLLDKWDLQPGHDANAFMESMVTEPSVRKVALLCDKKYAEKSNSRTGGAGTEAQIITPAIYSSQKQDKFVAIVMEKDDDGRAYLPTYYTSRIFIDLSDASKYTDEFEKFLRWVYDKPLYMRPEIGNKPAFISDTVGPKIQTTVEFRRALEAARTDNSKAEAIVGEYLEKFAQQLHGFRIAADRETINDFHEKVIASIIAFRPYRDQIVELFLAIARYRPTIYMVEILHRFFESLIEFLNPPDSVNISFGVDCDNLRFLIHEMFLCCIGAFIKCERFELAAYFVETEYYGENRYSNERMRSYTELFRDHLDSFDDRNRKLDLRRLSLRADLLKERAQGAGLDFKYIMMADFILYLRAIAAGRFWWPETLVFVGFRSNVSFEIFSRARVRTHNQ